MILQNSKLKGNWNLTIYDSNFDLDLPECDSTTRLPMVTSVKIGPPRNAALAKIHFNIIQKKTFSPQSIELCWLALSHFNFENQIRMFTLNKTRYITK